MLESPPMIYVPVHNNVQSRIKVIAMLGTLKVFVSFGNDRSDSVVMFY